MSAAVLVAFNVLVNAIGSFVVGALFAAVGLRAFRIAPGGARVALCTLPFVKVVFDAARGVPEQSFLFERAEGAFQDLGSFALGVGVHYGAVALHLALGAVRGGASYSQSAAELLGSGLARAGVRHAPAAFVAIAAAGALLFVARRVRDALAFHRAHRARLCGATTLGARSVGPARVPVHVLPGEGGTPFTAGLLAPHVCLPERTAMRLSADEREAAIAHELGHVAGFHLPLLVLVGALSDVLWFVPGMRWAERRLRDACELAADAWAVRRGVEPSTLASALLATAEHGAVLRDASSLALHPDRSMLSARVDALLAHDASRWAVRRRVLAAGAVAWLFAGAMLSVFFGNH